MKRHKGVLDEQRPRSHGWHFYNQRGIFWRNPARAAILFILFLIVTAAVESTSETEVQPFLLITISCLIICAIIAGLRILLLINKYINHWHHPHKRKNKR